MTEGHSVDVVQTYVMVSASMPRIRKALVLLMVVAMPC